MVSGFFQILGTLLLLVTSALAGAAIATILGGGENVADVMQFITARVTLSEQHVMIGAVALAWVIASLPAFLLLSIGINGETQEATRRETARAAQSLAEISEKFTHLLAKQEDTNRQLAALRTDLIKRG